jgi:hypothetical protein
MTTSGYANEVKVANWVELKPLKDRDAGLHPLLADVDAHVPNPGYWRSSDLGNWCHEGTHGVNARIRQEFNRPGFYLGGDRCLLATHPKFRCTEVAKYVPDEFRGFQYQTYAVGMAEQWDDQPLYLWDEWCAYVNGAAIDTNRKLTLTEYLPVALAVVLTGDLDADTEAALVELFNRTVPLLDWKHPYVGLIRTGEQGKPYREMFRGRGLDL